MNLKWMWAKVLLKLALRVCVLFAFEWTDEHLKTVHEHMPTYNKYEKQSSTTATRKKVEKKERRNTYGQWTCIWNVSRLWLLLMSQ